MGDELEADGTIAALIDVELVMGAFVDGDGLPDVIAIAMGVPAGPRSATCAS